MQFNTISKCAECESVTTITLYSRSTNNIILKVRN